MGRSDITDRFYTDFLGVVETVTRLSDGRSDNFTCNAILSKNNTIIEIDRGWNGIPETLVINLFLSMLLGICFILVRRVAKDGPMEKPPNWLHFIYGNRVRRTHEKLAANQRNVKHLSSSFGENFRRILPIHMKSCKASLPLSNSDVNLAVPTSSSPLDRVGRETPSNSSQKTSSNETINHEDIVISSGVSIQPSSTNPQRDSSDNLVQNETVFPIDRQRYSIFQRANSVYRLHNFLSQLFRLDEIYSKKGSDAYQYLLFQQYIIVLLTILSLICIFVLLPFNMQGVGDGKAFARTTISNLPNDSPYYWVHAFSATFIGIIGVYFMNYFSKVLKTDDDLMSRTTLLFRKIPIAKNGADVHHAFLEYFSNHFPNINICGLQVVYDYRKLDALQYELENIINAKHYCEKKLDKHKVPFMIRPHCLGRLGFCCACCCGKVNGDDFYSKQIDNFKSNIADELTFFSNSFPTAAFVTFENENMAMSVFKYFKEEQKKFFILRDCFRLKNDSFNLSRALVSYAPYPSDINWYNIGIDMRLHWMRKWSLNLVLFLIFFFLSTPAFMIKALDFLADTEVIIRGKGFLSSNMADFLTPFLLMLLAIILPSIVTYVQGQIPFKTVSALNHAIMSKVFWFLVMMILILPSAGFVSINAFFANIIDSNKAPFRWNCLFPVDNGAFFVIYTLQAAILGNTVELLRIPETFLYMLYNVIVRSSAEYEKARRMITFEFPFGVSYARFLLLFTITVTYSQACPLIAPAGLLYMLLKHFVDRYNILNVYTPSKINWKTHSTAILYVHIGLLFMLFQIFTVFLTKTSYSNVTIFSFIVLILFTLVFTFDCFYHWFRNINHITYSITSSRMGSELRRGKHDFCICFYTPQVFFNIHKTTTTTTSSSSPIAITVASSSHPQPPPINNFEGDVGALFSTTTKNVPNDIV